MPPVLDPIIVRYEVEMDFSIGLKKLIRLVGCTVGNNNIIPNFSVPPGQVVRKTLALIQFPAPISVKKAASEITGMKLIPGTLPEQLWLCLLRREVMVLRSAIIAPGSRWEGTSGIKLYPRLGGISEHQHLDLCQELSRYPPPYRFLASEPET